MGGFGTKRGEEEKEKRKKAYSTRYSQAVSHPSTNQARPCLASEIRRDRARSGWYGRRRRRAVALVPKSLLPLLQHWPAFLHASPHPCPPESESESYGVGLMVALVWGGIGWHEEVAGEVPR